MRTPVALVVRQRHLVVREEADEVGEQPSRDDDLGVAVDLAGERRTDRDLHVGRGKREVVALGLEEDAAEDLHGATGRDGTGDDGERRCEIGLSTGDAKRGSGGDVCVHY